MPKVNHSPGVVAQSNLGTIFQREIFFQVDPADLDYLDGEELAHLFPSGFFVELHAERYLHLLPEMEQEVFYMVHDRQKNQKDVAKLLSISQPTVSYRYRRALEKLNYLITLEAVNIRKIVGQLTFLKEHEKAILIDLFYCTNQELVGRKHEVRQSTVKWIFVKTKKRLAERELKDPDSWWHVYGLLLLLGRNLNTRVLH